MSHSSHAGGKDGEKPMTLAQLRHDLRNYLNAIKLSCALLQRRQSDPLSDESIREIDRSADKINELVTRHMGDIETARNLL
jgi:signal transduction histidine kinase